MTWSRRDFLRTSVTGLLAGALPPAGLLARPLSLDFRELRRNVGIFSARGGTIGWLVNREGAVVVDSQYPDTARSCLDGLAQRTGLPIDALVNSHHHGDHTGGNAVFRDSVRRIVAHERALELHRRSAEAGGSEATEAFADTTFEREWTLEVGDERVRAKHYGPAHTAGDCTIFFERADVVHMGDLVFNRVHPFIDRAGGASIEGWIGLLEAVASEHSADTHYVFGHGGGEFGVTGSRDDMLVQRDYLAAVLETARAARVAGRSREELVRAESLPAFPDHTSLTDWLSLGNALGAAWDELAEGR